MGCISESVSAHKTGGSSVGKAEISSLNSPVYRRNWKSRCKSFPCFVRLKRGRRLYFHVFVGPQGRQKREILLVAAAKALTRKWLISDIN